MHTTSRMGSKTICIEGFPTTATAQSATEFLEQRAGKGTIYALKFRLPKHVREESRAYAIVQFLTNEDAESIADMRLVWSDGVRLKVRDAKHDIEPNPRIFLFVLENTTLHFGSPVSQNKLSSLWCARHVTIKFVSNLRKIYFFLSRRDHSYKLELACESIREIQLHRSSAKDSQFLLIQVKVAPKVYELSVRNSGLVDEDPKYNYFKDLPDDQWVRTTDFTPSCSLGQSAALCLQIPKDCDLANIRHYDFYKEVKGDFRLESGSSYSSSLDLVPIVKPRPQSRIEVPYKILFKINHMVQNGTLLGPTLDDNFFKLVSPQYKDAYYIECAIEEMYYSKSSIFDPAYWLTKKYSELKRSNRLPKSPNLSLDAGLVYVYKVQVTPSKVCFNGPEVNLSNRVLRHFSKYIENFIRVSFVDEDWEKLYSTDLSSRSGSAGNGMRTALYNRILSVLRKGITIGDKKFEFLAFSSSQLRENSAWMFASNGRLTAADIREWMGDFHEIRNVAKYAARLGQSFSSSIETLPVRKYDIDDIPDVRKTKYLFSDGIGKISPKFAEKVAEKYGLEATPSAFQIRYAGYKGVVAVDPTSSKKLSLRESMRKYNSDNTKLDVLAYSKYQPCFLNRQLIILLSTLGVVDRIFEMKQKKVVDQLDNILTDPKKAREAIEIMHQGEATDVLKGLLSCGYKPDSEPFLSMLLQTLRASRLLELRTKSRIFVPEGRTMMGCLDETGTLEYGQVFVQVSCTGNRQFYNNGPFIVRGHGSDHRTAVLKAKVVVAKNPCLHPGDIRVLSAVDVPDLYHMVDCVVFPRKGKRPHPNECSGSDLDGDLYFVSWDAELIPPRVVEPMDYTSASIEPLDHDVTIQEVMKYFTNYIVNDSLGIIANAHTVFADKEPLKAESDKCKELARLFSIAVDSAKTGVPAKIPSHLHVKEYPDFMEKLDKVTYESRGVIGMLYRAINDHAHQPRQIKPFTKEVARKSYDPDMEVDGFEEYVDEAFWLKGKYDFKLGNLMEQYGIKTEAEILCGSVMEMSKTSNKYKDVEAIGLAVRLEVESLRKEVRARFYEKHINREDEDELCAKASAWYHVTYHPSFWGRYNEGLNRPHFLSFPWCVYEKLKLIKKRKRFYDPIERMTTSC